MVRALFILFCLALPTGAGAVEPWVVGEQTCTDVAVRELVAMGQTIECQIAETGKTGACSISGRCAEVQTQENNERPTIGALGQFAIRFSEGANTVLSTVGNTLSSFVMVAPSASGASARPFGASTETQEHATLAPRLTARAFLCGTQSFVPGFLIRFIPTYNKGSLCGSAGEVPQEVQFTAGATNNRQVAPAAVTPSDSGLFIIVDPPQVNLGGRASVRWGAAGMGPGSCTLIGPGIKERGNWGSASTPAIFEATTFTLTCTGLDGKERQKSTLVDIGA